MRRGQYFSGNYGSALGDTRTAANLIAQAGATQGQMFENLGKQISSTLEKFRINKEKKEGEQRAENQFLNLYEGNPENPIFKNLGIQSTDEAKAVAKDISKDPQLIQQAMQFAQFATVQQQAQDTSALNALQRRNLNMQMERQRNADQLANQEREKSQTQSQNFNRFLQAGGSELLQTDQGQGIYNRMVQSGVNPQTALKNVQAFEQRIAQSQPKPMTPKELADYEGTLLDNRKKERELDQKENPKPTANLAYTEATLNAISDAENILNSSKFATGFFGDRLKNIGGTAAANLKASIDTIRASIGFDKLQDMRDRSPTGGALGQVSERELSQLNASLGSLEQSQDAEQFRTNLMRVKDHYQKYYKATMAQVKAYEQGLKFETEEEAMSWYNKNFPMGGQPSSDNQINVTTPGGFSIRKN